MKIWGSLKNNWYLQTVLPWQKGLQLAMQSKSIFGGMSDFGHEAPKYVS